MMESLTYAEASNLKEGAILSCLNKNGYYIGILGWNVFGEPIFRTNGLNDGLEDSWRIHDWSKYKIATESEFVLWKFEHA